MSAGAHIFYRQSRPCSSTRSQTPVWERTPGKLRFPNLQRTESLGWRRNRVSQTGVPKREFGNENYECDPSLLGVISVALQSSSSVPESGRTPSEPTGA